MSERESVIAETLRNKGMTETDALTYASAVEAALFGWEDVEFGHVIDVDWSQSPAIWRFAMSDSAVCAAGEYMISPVHRRVSPQTPAEDGTP